MEKLYRVTADGDDRGSFPEREAAEQVVNQILNERQFSNAVELHEIRILAKYEVGIVAVQKPRKRTVKPKDEKAKGKGEKK